MLRPVAIALAAGCLALAACGDDEEEEAPGASTDPGATTTTFETTLPPPEKAPAEARKESEERGPSVSELVELVLASDNPGDVCEPPNVTETFLRTGYGGAAGCAQAIEAGGAIAESVDVEVTEETAGAATAVATTTGGVYDGEEIELALIEVDGRWSVDRLEVDIPAGP